jgi:hypothetical protein
MVCVLIGVLVLPYCVLNKDTPCRSRGACAAHSFYLLSKYFLVGDHATTPSGTRAQVVFGRAVIFTCGLLMVLRIVFDLFFARSDLFFALSIVAGAAGSPWRFRA